MSTLGQRLRDERESRGARRADVAQATKVAAHHLAALEYGDFDALPDAVHSKGYVRVYAEYLGLDPAAALAEFLEEYEAACPGATGDSRDDVVRKMSKILTESERSQASRFRPVLVVVAVVAVLVLSWFGIRRIGGGGAGAPNEASTGAVTAPLVAEAQPRVPDPVEDSTESAPPEPATPPPAETRAAVEEVEPPPAVQPQAVAQKIEPPPAVEPPSPPAAAPTPTPTPTRTTPPARPGRVSISEHGVGTGVVNLRLKGESDRFKEGTRVSFWTRVLNGRSGEEIRHVWRHEGRLIASIRLTLGSANWRTYSRKTMYPGSVGSWTVEAVDASGNVLAAADFICEP